VTGPELTLGDIYLFADEKSRRAIDESFAGTAEINDRIGVKPEMLRLITTGGYRVRLVEQRSYVEVQIEVYRTGKAYGLWMLSCSPEGHEVRIQHCLPITFATDGNWSEFRLHESWACPIDAWRKYPAEQVEHLIGKKIAAEAAPLLPLPDKVAWDGSH